VAVSQPNGDPIAADPIKAEPSSMRPIALAAAIAFDSHAHESHHARLTPPVDPQERARSGAVSSFHFPGFLSNATSFSLTVVDLTQIEHMLLHNAAATDPVVLNDAPISVFFAVLFARGHSQEHALIVYEIWMAARG